MEVFRLGTRSAELSEVVKVRSQVADIWYVEVPQILVVAAALVHSAEAAEGTAVVVETSLDACRPLPSEKRMTLVVRPVVGVFEKQRVTAVRKVTLAGVPANFECMG